MKNILTIIAVLSFSIQLSAQDKCSHYENREDLYKTHPELKPENNEKHELLEDFTRNFKNSPFSKSNASMVIPVVFHVVHDNGVENISDSQIHESMVQINEDFSASNAGLSDVHQNFTNIISDIGINFRLADLDPNGEPTTGINRIQSSLTYNGGNIELKELIQWDPTMYLNIWVVYSSNGSNGSAFAYYPADVEGSGSIYDGVVSSYWAVGRTETAVWTHYKILTHEIGHWANLKHTWGDQSNFEAEEGCNYDDAVDDTPLTTGNWGCDLEAINCESQDNVQNYMDYSDCSNMFSEGQKTRMLAALNSEVGGRNNLWSVTNFQNVFILEDYLPRIIYQSNTFNESISNDGSLNSSIEINLVDLEFSSIGMLNVDEDFSFQNLPDGATILIEVVDSVTAQITLNGFTTNHSEVDNINDIEIHFNESSFSDVSYDEIYNPSKTNLNLNFINPYEIIFIDLVEDEHNFIEGQNWKWFSMEFGDADFGLLTYDKVNIKLETYHNSAVCEPGTRNLTPLDFGVEIGGETVFTEPGEWYPEQLDLANSMYSNWLGTTAYVGIEFQKNGYNHYGWLRLAVNETATHYWALDMAYNQAPNESIYTGQVGTPSLAYTQTVFHEAVANDGSIESVRNIDVFGTTWIDFNTITEGDGFNISVLPEGLTAVLNRVSDKQATLEIIGNSINHSNGADNFYLTVSFDQSLFEDSETENRTQNISIDFADHYGILHTEVSTEEPISVSSIGNEWYWFTLGMGNAGYGLWYVNDVFRLDTFGKSAVCNTDSTNLSVIPSGDTIGINNNWDFYTELETQLVISSEEYMDWNGETAYVGLKFVIAERNHFGWLKLQVSEDGTEVNLLEYAINTMPEEYIIAGQIAASYGCMDSLALNYNPNAIVANGTCEYPLDCGDDVALKIDMHDTYGDGWNNNLLTFINESGELEHSITFTGTSEGSIEFCIAEGCYTFLVDEGSYINEISWELYLDTLLIAEGYGDDQGSFSANGGCGCTSITALNFDPTAIEDDGSCIEQIDCGSDNLLQIYMQDTYGDGWNNAILSFNNELNEQVITLTMEEGSEENRTFCMADGCFIYQINPGSHSAEVSWQIYYNEQEVLSGFAPDQGTFSLNTEGCEDYVFPVYGCTDVNALNFDELANTDDETCEYPFVCEFNTLLINMQDDYGDGWNNAELTITNSNNEQLSVLSLESGSSGESLFCLEDGCYSYSINSGSYPNEIDWQISFNGIQIIEGLAPEVGQLMVNSNCGMPIITTQSITLEEDWSMFSTYITPIDLSFSNLMSPIIDFLIIVKDFAGNAFVPEWNFNGIDGLENKEAYQVKVSNECELLIEGIQIMPEDYPLTLNTGWNMISYLRDNPMPVTTVFESVITADDLFIIKDHAGNVYLPNWNYNGIGNLVPGEGYQLKMNNTTIFSYPQN